MLTAPDCLNAKCPPDKKQKRFFDSGGLLLQVSPAGSKRWFYKYKTGGKEKMMALGGYPEMTLAQARQARDAAKLLRAQGDDPIEAKKLAKAASPVGAMFKEVALEWFEKQVPNWSPSHAARTKRNLEKDLFPFIGDRAMAEITPMQLLDAIKRVEGRGSLETARRVLDTAGQVWTYWLPTTPIQQRNITEGLKTRLTPRVKGHFAAILEPQRFGELLRAIRAYKGGPLVRTALQIAPVLYQRPYNLRSMAWAELDLEARLWTIPSEKMKRTVNQKLHGEDHVVPMPNQVVKLLEGLLPISGHGKYVFPSERDHNRPLSDNSVRSALYALGFGTEQSWHGFRASARTMLVDQLGLDPLVIEANLAHAVKDSNGRSYNRTQYLPQRFEMVQRWADYLDELVVGNLVDMQGKRLVQSSKI